jgi:mono/diheme cytochrome c family protein
MKFGHRTIIAALCAVATCFASAARAQDAAANPGRDMVLGKCFQCHSDSGSEVTATAVRNAVFDQ